jgi:hypothetical protein
LYQEIGIEFNCLFLLYLYFGWFLLDRGIIGCPRKQKGCPMTSMEPEQGGSPTMAYFISPHGFGHAARASAIMSVIQERNPGIRFEIFTTVPRWFFKESLTGTFFQHDLLTDVGLVQEGPLRANLTETVTRLDEWLPFAPKALELLAEKVTRLACSMILCDISPLGIAVAREAGLPSVLVENFTWDWVYGEYAFETAGFKPHMDYLETLFSWADVHIQTTPVCLKRKVHLTTEPVSRKPRTDRFKVRKDLGIPDRTPMVLITMGGIPKDHRFIEQLAHQKEVFFVAPGGGTAFRTVPNVRLLPHHSRFFHPDLVHAADAVVGKVGYSTLGEVYHAGIPFGYIKRTKFRESEILSSYIEKRMMGFAIDENEFETGGWILRVPELLELPTLTRKKPNGAERAADFILNWLNPVTK